MICLKCRAEIEDLSMYCPRCGAPQFAYKPEEEITLELTDPMKSKVILLEAGNLTAALSRLKEITGLPIPELRNRLKELPAVLFDHLSEEEAEEKAKQLNEAGLKAEADHGKKEAVSIEEESTVWNESNL